VDLHNLRRLQLSSQFGHGRADQMLGRGRLHAGDLVVGAEEVRRCLRHAPGIARRV